MIDLHTHTLLSDGVLLPSELIRRAEAIGISVIGIADHADKATIHTVIPQLVSVCRELNSSSNSIRALPGVELTHIPPEQIKKMVTLAKSLGASYIVAHGETICEPVKEGTNKAAILAGVNILAHPGFITTEEALLAKEQNCYLEISGRPGHSFTNGHVARTAQKTGAKCVFNTDSHLPSDLMGKEMAGKCIAGAGIEKQEVKKVFQQSEELVSAIGENW